MCECYQIGGRFIAEDPDCPVHGSAAQECQDQNEERISELEARINYLENEYLSHPICDESTAAAYMESRLWEFIDMAAIWGTSKIDSRIWDHVKAYTPPSQQ